MSEKGRETEVGREELHVYLYLPIFIRPLSVPSPMTRILAGFWGNKFSTILHAIMKNGN